MEKILKHPVISSVIAGVVLAALGYVWQNFEKVVGQVKSGASALWSMASYEIRLPLWVAVVVAIGAFLYLHQAKKAAHARQQKLAKPEEDRLSELENRILSMHAGLQEDHGMVASEIAEMASLHIEFARLKMEELAEKGYIVFAFYADNEESAFRLTSKGRRYVVDNGLVGHAGEGHL